MYIIITFTRQSALLSPCYNHHGWLTGSWKSVIPQCTLIEGSISVSVCLSRLPVSLLPLDLLWDLTPQQLIICSPPPHPPPCHTYTLRPKIYLLVFFPPPLSPPPPPPPPPTHTLFFLLQIPIPPKPYLLWKVCWAVLPVVLETPCHLLTRVFFWRSMWNSLRAQSLSKTFSCLSRRRRSIRFLRSAIRNTSPWERSAVLAAASGPAAGIVLQCG